VAAILLTGVKTDVMASGIPFTFEDLGEPVLVRELTMEIVTHDPQNGFVAWSTYEAPDRHALVGVRTDSGETIWVDLTRWGRTHIQMIQAADGNPYVYAGSPGHFFKYDLAAGKLVDLGVPASPASYWLGSAIGPDEMIYTGTFPSKGRLGGALARINPDDFSCRVWTNIVANQSIVGLASVADLGGVFCTSSIHGGSSAIPTEKEALVFLWDCKREEVAYRARPVAGTKHYGAVVPARNGLLYGIAGTRYYAFDPARRETVFTGELPVKGLRFPELSDEPAGPRGLIYGVGDDAVFAIDPTDHVARIVARDKSLARAMGFFVTPEQTLYYGAGSRLMRVRLGGPMGGGGVRSTPSGHAADPFTPELEIHATALAATMRDVGANVVRMAAMGKYATIQGVVLPFRQEDRGGMLQITLPRLEAYQGIRFALGN